MTLSRRALVGLALLSTGSTVVRAEDAAPATPPAAAAPVDSAAVALLEKSSPAVVSIKYVLKSGGEEQPYEAQGTVIDPTGLIVLSNEYLGSAEQKAVDLKVLFGSDPKEWGSVVVARDAVLGLAWVQVVGVEKPLAYVDLASSAADPTLGQDLRSIHRASRGFDFAPVLNRHYVAATIEKPRSMWSLAGDEAPLGAVVFDLAGRPVGVTAQQSGSGGAEDALAGTFLLPLKDAKKSLELARKRVADALAKAAEKSKEPKDEKDDAAKKDDTAKKDGGKGDGKDGKNPEPTPETPPDHPPKEPARGVGRAGPGGA